MKTNATGQKQIFPNTAAVLGGLGVVPFVVAAVLANTETARDVGLWLLVGYGAVILSFLGGIQWGLGLGKDRARPLFFLWSIVVSLTGWVALLLAPVPALMLLGTGFVSALAFDLFSVSLLDLPRWFVGLRLVLTGSVLVCIGLALVPRLI